MREESLETLEEKLLPNLEITLEKEKKEFKTRREQAGLLSTILFWWAVPLIKTGLGYDLTNTVSVALFSKSLRFSLLSTDQYKLGGLVNLLQVDAQRLINLCNFLPNMLFLPLQLIIGLLIMQSVIGVSFLFGFAVMLVMCTLNFCIGKRQLKYQKLQMKAKDERMKVTTEIFSAIKFIKANAWEEYFYNKLDTKRQQELSHIKNRFICGTLSIFSLWVTPNLIINATLAGFILLGHDITAESAFTVISIFSILQEPIRSIPVVINFFIETYVSSKRIQEYLLAKEIDTSFITNDESNTTYAITIQNGYFSWREDKQVVESQKNDKQENNENIIIDKNQKKEQRLSIYEQNKARLSLESSFSSDRNESVVNFHQLAAYLEEDKKTKEQNEKEIDKQYILKDINLKIKKGTMVALVGEVGCGKSSILQCLIGEMKHTQEKKPSVEISGDISFVTQKPWIMNATVKDNILFGQKFDEKKYQDCLKFSCLLPDLQVLSDGDLTQIGEKGVNLSGGQKARISLARAIYSESDILLLDDILSAVDVHVGKSLMQDCLMNYRKQTTRVIATHALHYLKYMDYICIMKEGRIIEEGEYSKISQKEQFQVIYQQYMKDHCQETQTGILVDEEEILESELKTKQERNGYNNNENEINNPSNILLSTSEDESKQQDTSQDIISPEKAKDNDTITIDSDVNDNLPVNESEAEDSIDEDNSQMIKEVRNKGKISRETVKLFLKMNGGFKFIVTLFIVMSFWLGLKVASSLWIQLWTESSANSQDNTYYLTIYSILSISYGFFAMIRAGLCLFSSLRQARDLHRQMISALIFAPLTSFFDRVPLGRLLNVLSKDLQVLDLEIGYYVGGFLTTLFSIIGDAALCVYTSSYLVIIPLIVFILACKLVQEYYMSAQREVIRLETVSRSPIISFFAESLSGLSSIRAYNQQARFLKDHCTKIDENKKCQLSNLALQSWFTQNLTFLSLTVNTCAISFCLFWSSNNPSKTGLLLTFAFSLNQSVQWLIQTWNNLEKSFVSIERCQQQAKVKPEKGYKTYLQNRAVLSKEKDSLNLSNPLQNWPSYGNITFQNVFLRYRPNLPCVLNGISVSIKAAQKIGVAGRTGAGKSTITLSLLRILEIYKGKIIIDGIDISQLRLDQLRHKITIILQDAQLFEGSLRDNIDPLKEHTEKDIIEALNECQLQRLVDSEKGLEMQISEGGENLSVGEKQLVCIARALLKKTKIVLIDEATANIDASTDHLIQMTIARVFKKCTVLTIAHRLNTILQSDLILVLAKGQVAEFDSPNNLLKNPHSAFYSLHQESIKENKI